MPPTSPAPPRLTEVLLRVVMLHSLLFWVASDKGPSLPQDRFASRKTSAVCTVCPCLCLRPLKGRKGGKGRLLFIFFFFSEKRKGEKIKCQQRHFYLGAGGEAIQSNHFPAQSPSAFQYPSLPSLSPAFLFLPCLQPHLQKETPTTAAKKKVDQPNF